MLSLVEAFIGFFSRIIKWLLTPFSKIENPKLVLSEREGSRFI